jgi:predicted MFS family arabinose efflux permease
MKMPDEADLATRTGGTTRVAPSLPSAIVLVVLGMDTFIVQPGFVQGLVNQGGYAPTQAGLIASTEMFGIAATTVLMMWLAPRVDWHRLVRIALIVDVAGNLLCLAAHSALLFACCRFVVGLASGILISVGYAVAGLTAKPDRSFGWLITWVLVYGATGLLALPPVLSTVGIPGFLVFLASAAAAGLYIVALLPRGATVDSAISCIGREQPKLMRHLLLGAVLCYFLGQGSLWAYLSLIGVADGGTDQQVATALTIAQFLGIAGAATAATAGTRMRHLTAILTGILGGTAPILLFLTPSGALIFAVAVCVFNFAANFITPLLMAVVAKGDTSGKLVVYSVALQMLGLAIGPAIAALVIRPGDYALVIYLGVALFLLCLGLVVPPVAAQARDDAGLRAHTHGR